MGKMKKQTFKKSLIKNASQKLVSFVFVAVLLCSIFAGVVSAENAVDESDALSGAVCCNNPPSPSISGNSTTSNSSDNNSLSSEIDRFLDANKPVFLFFYTDQCHLLR